MQQINESNLQQKKLARIGGIEAIPTVLGKFVVVGTRTVTIVNLEAAAMVDLQ